MKFRSKRVVGRSFGIAVAMFLGIGNSQAQQDSDQTVNVASLTRVQSLPAAIERVASQHPEVRASWHNFEAAREEERAAQGRYYPRVDFSGQSGKVDSDDPQFLGDDYSSTSTRLAVTQQLYDGGATRSLVNKLNNLKIARYYELRDVSESLALEVTQAYLDVLRFRRLVQLAEDNYIEHRLVYEDIQQRASAGVSRAVDLEQAEARLALAESNLLTETTNLHDVTRRYVRLVGETPPQELNPPAFPSSIIPASRASALTEAFQESPLLLASVYNQEAARFELREKNAAYLPTLDLRARQDNYDDDTDGLGTNFDESAVELVFSYNLFRGGSDAATKRQFREEVNARTELREKACRDVTQEVSIAYNNITSLRQQKALLDRNLTAIDKVRTAYRNQFDIGQRTLLDLLDTENEYFDIRRAQTNAEFDLLLAQASTLAGMGRLLTSFGVEGVQQQARSQVELPEASTSGYCTLNTTIGAEQQRDEIMARVLSSERLKARREKR